MKIIFVEVAAFGKLKGVKVDFLPTFNLICNVNGFGKTTLAAFVRAMLFGLNYNYTKSGAERINDVTRYCPWNSSGKFGGAMTVEHQGKNYRIERYFGQTARAESLSVIETASGKKLDVTDVGGYFLGLTADSFDRSTYFPQEYVELASNENISSRLANVVESGADYETAAAKIREYKKSFKYERGVGGLIYELSEKHAEALRDLEQSKKNVEEKSQAELRLRQIESQAEQIKAKKADCQARLAELNKQILRSEPTEADMNAQKIISEAELKLAQYPADFEELTRHIEEIGNQAEKCAEKPQTSKLTKWILLAAAIAVAIGGGLCFLFNTIVACALLGVAAVLGVCVAAVKAKPTASAIQKKQCLDEYFRFASRIVDCSDYDYYKTKSAVAALKRQYYQDCSRFAALKENAPAPLVSQNELSAMRAQAQALENNLEQLSAQSNALIAESARLSAYAESVTDNRAEKEDCVLSVWQQLTKAKQDYEVACKVADLLAEAKQNLSTSYLPKLCARTAELLNATSGGNYRVVLDGNFAVSVIENGQTHGFSAYSRGIRELTLLCFRIALSEMLYGGKIPLLILDDALVNFDDGNYARAIKLLKSMTPQTQIVYLTCHMRNA